MIIVAAVLFVYNYCINGSSKCLQDFREISSKLIFDTYHAISDHEYVGAVYHYICLILVVFPTSTGSR